MIHFNTNLAFVLTTIAVWIIKSRNEVKGGTTKGQKGVNAIKISV